MQPWSVIFGKEMLFAKSFCHGISYPKKPSFVAVMTFSSWWFHFFSLRFLGKWSKLTSIFFKWVETTWNYQLAFMLTLRWCFFKDGALGKFHPENWRNSILFFKWVVQPPSRRTLKIERWLKRTASLPSENRPRQACLKKNGIILQTVGIFRGKMFVSER